MAEPGYLNHLLNSFRKSSESTTAFTVYNGKTITNISYPHFAEDISRTIAFFREHNIMDRHIALLCPEDYDFFVCFFAIVLSGNIAVILNPSLSNDTTKWQCEQADVSVICATTTKIEELEPMCQDVVWLNRANVMAHPSGGNGDMIPVNDCQTVLMMFTSGTTGQSKAVELSSRNLQACAESANVMYDTPGMEIAFHAIPRYHIGGFRSAMVCFNRLEPVYIGRGIRYIFMDIPVLNPKCIVVVPSMLDSLVKLLKKTNTASEREQYLGTRLQRICVGGASLKPEIARYLMDLGITIDVIYGMTETACIGTWCSLDREHLRTIGKPFGGMDCSICDGEILLKGPAVMKGYYRDPEETSKVKIGEWIHTGDIGYCDEFGYYYLTGRKKNVIILSNGENVNPEEIEDIIGNSSSIIECLVYSDGRGICADVYTLDPNASAQDIHAYNENTPSYRQIYKVNYKAIPLTKTASGKIKRKENTNEV